MLDFQKIRPEMRAEYENYLLPLGKSCEYAFTNLCIWGRQRATVVDGYLVLFSLFDRVGAKLFSELPGFDPQDT